MEERLLRLSTPRLILEPLVEEDREALLSVACDPRVTKSYMFPEFASREQKDAFFERLKSISETKERLLYAIHRDGAFLGFLNEVCKGGDSIEIGYVIVPDEWNKGYATEAFSAVIAELFRMGYRRVKAGHFVDNPASGRVMQKCGMTCLGIQETVEYRGEAYPCVDYVIEHP